MNANVVPIDYRAQARARSDDAKRQKAAERSKRLVAAIKKNRRARLLATKQLWLGVTGVAAIVGLFAGVASTLAWQHGTSKMNEDPTHLPVQQLSKSAVNELAQPAVIAAPNVINNIASGTTNMPATATVLANPSNVQVVGKVPPGKPPQATAPAAVMPSKSPAPSPVFLSATTEPKEQPNSVQAVKREQQSTQYEAPIEPKPVVKVAPDATNFIATDALNKLAKASLSNYQIIGVPVDGVVQIKIGNNPTVKPIRVGEQLPNGEVLKRANAETGQIETSERVLKVN